MVYSKYAWLDGSANNTPINATRLNAIEQGIFGAHQLSGNSVLREYIIPAADLANYSSGATDAVKTAAISKNNAAVKAAMASYPDSIITLDPSQAWPLQLSFDGFDGNTQTPVRIRGRLKQPRGTRTSSSDTTSGRIIASNVISINRVWETGQSISALATMTGGATSSVNWYQPSQQVTKISLSTASNIAGWRQGDIAVIASNDYYAYSARAGYSNNVWKAQKVHINSIGMDVTNYSITAASNANVAASTSSDPRSSMVANGNSSQGNGMEGRYVKGSTSNVTALVRGDTGASQLFFATIPGNFTVNETLVDVLTGQSIGTVGSMYLVANGKLYGTYTTTPVIRRVPRDIPVFLDVEVEADGDTEDQIFGYNRAAEIGLTGTYDNNITVKIKSGYQRGVSLISCFRGNVSVQIAGLPNHAMENELSEDAYGYGVVTAGCTEDLKIYVDVENVRHGFSTNVLGGTYNLKSGGGTGTDAQSLNYQKYGTTRNCIISGTAKATFGAGFDTHEGCEGLIFENFRVTSPFWSGRQLSAGVGINTRGFNTIIRNGFIENVKDGIFDSSQSTPIGIPRSDTVIQNVVVDNFQEFGYCTNDDVASGQAIGAARTFIDSCVFRGDPDIPTTMYNQAGVMSNRGWLMTRDVTVQSSNNAMITHKGDSTNNKLSGIGIHINPIFDFTEGTANTCVRYEGHMEVAAVINQSIIAFGTNRPGFVFRHEAGVPASGVTATKVQWWGQNLIQASTTSAAPVLNQNNSSSVATAVRLADPGEGSSAVATHSVSAAPTVVAGANASGATVTFTAGSTDVSGEVQVVMGTTAGTANGPVAVITFGTAFGSDVFPVVSGWQGSINRTAGVWLHSATSLSIGVANALAASTTYKFTYYVPGV